MIIISDILTLMRLGFSHKKIRFGMSVKELREQMGDPDSIIGDKQRGYLMYNPLRVGYQDDIIEEIAILFGGRNDLKFNTNLENIDGEIDAIGSDTKIHELIKLFNIHGIKWQCQYKKNELDYVSITIENGSEVLFELDAGLIYRIAFAPNTQ